MRIGAQPRGRTGTVEHPYSALDLRLVLAVFGLVTSAAFALLLARAGAALWAWFFVALAATAAVDVVVVQLRRRARRRGGDGR